MASHKADMPLSQLPVLEFDGTKLPQSMSIARFLAKQFHLAGKDNFEQAKVDAFVDTINDTLTNFLSTYYEKDETKKQELQKKYFAEELPKHLQNLENLGKLYGNGGSYFVGSHLTWADLYFYVASEYLLESAADCLTKNPWLEQNRAEVEKQPRIAEYLKNRPKTSF
jgi:glutathione S-transferase